MVRFTVCAAASKLSTVANDTQLKLDEKAWNMSLIQTFRSGGTGMKFWLSWGITRSL